MHPVFFWLPIRIVGDLVTLPRSNPVHPPVRQSLLRKTIVFSYQVSISHDQIGVLGSPTFAVDGVRVRARVVISESLSYGLLLVIGIGPVGVVGP